MMACEQGKDTHCCLGRGYKAKIPIVAEGYEGVERGCDYPQVAVATEG